MGDNRLSIRLDLANGGRVGPGKIALLEAIRATGSIAAAARALGMSYRRAWLLVEEINRTFRAPAVVTSPGGRAGGGTAVTEIGEKLILLYRCIERNAHAAARRECGAVGRLARRANT